MPANNASTWTAAREMQLVALWDQDFSAQTIALKMGGVSRNGVLGKVFRLRLSKRHSRNAYFYDPDYQRPEQPRRIPKKFTCRTVFPTREQKPRARIIDPHAKPALTTVTSVISGVFKSVHRRPRVPEMTKPELRAMLTQAMLNTGGHL